jgi:hypothetical protein
MARSPEQEPRPSRLSLEEVIRTAKEITLQDGGHVPTVLAEGGGVTIATQLEFRGTHQERVATMHAAGFALGKSGQLSQLEQVFFISEGWMSIPEEGKLEVPPSQDPNRIEVLLISRLDMAESQADLVMFEMVRQDEALVALREYNPGEPKDLNFDSPLVRAFADGYRRGRGADGNGAGSR